MEVQDSGAGINEGDMDKIFQAFYTTKPDGMGIGLAITRSIVDAHGVALRPTITRTAGRPSPLPYLWIR